MRPWVPLLFVVGCGGSPQAAPAPSTPQTADALGASLRTTFVEGATKSGMIGAQLAVSIPGEPLWSTEFGVNQPGDPMRGDLLLGTGSISKMLAAVAALRLVDRGDLALTDTLGRWFPAIPNVPPDLTLRQLLWHQSGLSEYGESAEYSRAVLADLNRTWQPEELLRFLGPPAFAPGAAWAASNTDRLLLSIIVSRTSGLPYGEYLSHEMFNQGEGAHWTPGQLTPTSKLIGTHWVLDSAGAPVNYSAQLFGPSLFTSRARDVSVGPGNGDIRPADVRWRSVVRGGAFVAAHHRSRRWPDRRSDGRRRRNKTVLFRRAHHVRQQRGHD